MGLKSTQCSESMGVALVDGSFDECPRGKGQMRVNGNRWYGGSSRQSYLPCKRDEVSIDWLCYCGDDRIRAAC